MAVVRLIVVEVLGVDESTAYQYAESWSQRLLLITAASNSAIALTSSALW